MVIVWSAIDNVADRGGPPFGCTETASCALPLNVVTGSAIQFAALATVQLHPRGAATATASAPPSAPTFKIAFSTDTRHGAAA
jgi:hypothetical protein